MLLIPMAIFTILHSGVPTIPDSKVHGANMGPTWVLSAPDGPQIGHMNFAIRDNKLLRSHRVCFCHVKIFDMIFGHVCISKRFGNHEIFSN